MIATMGLLYSFGVGMGMFFLFTALAFLVTYICQGESWLVVPIVTLGGIGIVIMMMGLGKEARGVLLQLGAIGIVALGITMIIQHKRKQ